ncbi:polysaccharide deacetylase [Paenibacillus yanchengensis]|uniref:Polysaccharide deacetylase n=1 Tax=Paenibacillus yanchengensis TaxID=2035833 RepID=A0ABW4YFA3_9BACL
MTVSLMKAMKFSIQFMWMVWEGIFDFLTKFRSESIWRFGICKLVVKKYNGKGVILKNGQQIVAGEWIGELHLDNSQVLKLTRTVGADQAGLSIARMLQHAMVQMASEIDNQSELKKVQALMGITLLRRGLTHGLGFEQHPIESKWQQRIITVYLRMLLRVLHPEGNKRIQRNKKKLTPCMLVISSSSLKERFLLNKQ